MKMNNQNTFYNDQSVQNRVTVQLDFYILTARLT